MTINIKVNPLSLASVLAKLKVSGEKVLLNSHAIHMQVCKEIYEKIVFRTPVGNPSLWKHPAPKNYDPGTLKKSWELKFNGADVKKDVIATIFNPQPYAYRVEYGWSHIQAPQGMVRITMREFRPILRKAALKWRL